MTGRTGPRARGHHQATSSSALARSKSVDTELRLGRAQIGARRLGAFRPIQMLGVQYGVVACEPPGGLAVQLVAALLQQGMVDGVPHQRVREMERRPLARTQQKALDQAGRDRSPSWPGHGRARRGRNVDRTPMPPGVPPCRQHPVDPGAPGPGSVPSPARIPAIRSLAELDQLLEKQRIAGGTHDAALSQVPAYHRPGQWPACAPRRAAMGRGRSWSTRRRVRPPASPDRSDHHPGARSATAGRGIRT